MKLNLLWLFLWAHSSWGVSSGTFAVTQTPSVAVMEGQAANITCCWTEMFERVLVNWLKNQTLFESESVSKNNCQASLQNEQCKCSTLTLTYVTREHSGTYTCRINVDIPVYTVFEGNGTVITVTAREHTGDNGDIGKESHVIIPETRGNIDPTIYKTTAGDAHQEDVLSNILRCLPVLAVFITFCYLNNSGSEAQLNTPAAPENKATSAQRPEQDQEEEERAESVTEKGEEKDRAIND